MYCTNNHWVWFWPFGFFAFIILFFVISRVFWWRGSWRRGNRGNWQGYSREDSLEILKQRYAKGEIDKEQFESMKKDIGKQS